MIHRIKIWAPLIAAVFVLMAHTAYAQPETRADRTLSPYFFVKSNEPDVDQLPLKSTSVDVSIAGVIADVVVTQVYENKGKTPLEAIYIFPASTRAAVYGMKMTIGERTITAKIRTREQARQEYEDAKHAGRNASLLEQHRPNVFQMNVANIMPSDIIKVELKYTELLVPTDAVYEFVYPTVVGPRYSNQPGDQASPSEKWVENPYFHQGELPPYTFVMNMNIDAGLPIQDIRSPSHKVNVAYDGLTFASIMLDRSERYGGNRDFIVTYRLAGGKIETGLLLYKGEEENFFLAMLQPPKQVHDNQIPPREYIFIVDVSGSMHGFPINISKKLLKDLIGNLRPTDRFNVLLFAGSSSVMAQQSLPATPANIRRAINTIEQQRGGGGTELLPALKRALSLPRSEGCSRTVVIVTDGYVSVEEQTFDLIRNNLGEANMFAFGIGSSVNRHIIEGMARVGMGEPFVITKPEEAPEKAEKFGKLIRSPVLTGITADFGKFKAYDVEPPGIPDVLADRPVIVFGKWRGTPRGSIRIRGVTGNRRFTETIDVADVTPLKTNAALRYLWARHRIALLADYNKLGHDDERVTEVTNLGLTYNLLTAYTSFVAIDTRVRVQNGNTVTVKQPLPLPQGVSDYAVGKVACAKAGPYAGPVVMRETVKAEEKCLEYKKKDECSDSSGNSGLGKRHVELGTIAVTKGVSGAAIKQALIKHMRAIDHCYTAALGRRPVIKGEIVVTVTINAQGHVTKAHIDKSAKHHKRLAQCIVDKLKTARFPAPKKGNKGVITITFIIK